MGSEVGITKKGKGTKIIIVVHASGLPIAVHTSAATPAENTLVHDTLEASFGLDGCADLAQDVEHLLRMAGRRALDRRIEHDLEVADLIAHQHLVEGHVRRARHAEWQA